MRQWRNSHHDIPRQELERLIEAIHPEEHRHEFSSEPRNGELLFHLEDSFHNNWDLKR